MGLIMIKISLPEKSYSDLKKRFPTMCETLEALRNPPLHMLEEERIIKKVFLLLYFVIFIDKCIIFLFSGLIAHTVRNTRRHVQILPHATNLVETKDERNKKNSRN